jgi:hypothetical protein
MQKCRLLTLQLRKQVAFEAILPNQMPMSIPSSGQSHRQPTNLLIQIACRPCKVPKIAAMSTLLNFVN